MKKKKYLPLYYKWMERRSMEIDYSTGCTGGLCGSPAAGELLRMFEPVDGEATYSGDPTWWAAENCGDFDYQTLKHSFTPLRQTIVLFLAAMNDEL